MYNNVQQQASKINKLEMNNETEQIFLLNPSESQQSAPSQKLNEASIASQGVEDFSTVCRTCATVTEFVIPIFDGEGVQNNLAEKIHKHLPIQVSETDVLPRVVCYQCASTLLAWHELVQCCVQADAALRTRLAVAAAKADNSRTIEITESKTSSKENNQHLEQEQNKFKEIAEFVVRSIEPPQYVAPEGKTCEYCSTEYTEDAYKEHLLAAHSDYLFHCDECDTFVDRKDFILHMSLHAVEYTAKQNKKAGTIKRVKKIKKRKSQAKDENENNEKSKRKSTRKVKSDAISKTVDVGKITDSVTDLHENVFSDHSDTEYGFGPIPESVFEAIEDSQDSQPTNNNEVTRTQIEDLVDQPCGKDRSDASADTDTANPAAPPRDTVKSNKKSRTCPICGKVYTASSSYFYHMKYFHNRSREHECELCGKKFGTRGCLMQHKATHSGDCPYECKECGKRFRSMASLYIHEQAHSGVKSWSCSLCHMSFRWRTHLARHMKRHAAKKVHVCSTCGRGFSVRCDMLRHARTHAAEDHVCTQCGVTFAQLRYLKVHMERKHEKPAQI